MRKKRLTHDVERAADFIRQVRDRFTGSEPREAAVEILIRRHRELHRRAQAAERVRGDDARTMRGLENEAKHWRTEYFRMHDLWLTERRRAGLIERAIGEVTKIGTKVWTMTDDQVVEHIKGAFNRPVSRWLRKIGL